MESSLAAQLMERMLRLRAPGSAAEDAVMPLCWSSGFSRCRNYTPAKAGTPNRSASQWMANVQHTTGSTGNSVNSSPRSLARCARYDPGASVCRCSPPVPARKRKTLPRDLIATAAPTNRYRRFSRRTRPGSARPLLRLLIGLVVVCGLCVLVARWFRPKPTAVGGEMEALASIEVRGAWSTSFAPATRRLLVGTDLGGVKAILELPGAEPELPLPSAEASEIPSAIPAAQPSSGEILKLLLQLHANPTQLLRLDSPQNSG